MVRNLGSWDLRRRVQRKVFLKGNLGSQDKPRGLLVSVDPRQLLLLLGNLGSRGNGWSLMAWKDRGSKLYAGSCGLGWLVSPG